MKKLACILASLVIAGAAFAKTNGVALATETYLRQDKGNGGVEWVMTVPTGTVLELDNENVYNLTLVAGTKKTDGVEFYKVQYEGKSYYAQTKQVAASATPAAILKNTVIFTKPRISAFTNAEIDFASIVAAGKKVNFEGIDFTEVQYFSESKWSVVTVYVLSSDVSLNTNDVKALMVVDKINATKDDAVKQALIKSAVSLNTSNTIDEYIDSIDNEINGVELITSQLSHEFSDSNFVNEIYTEDGSKVNVRKEPKNGEVVAQLESGKPVRVFRETDNTDTIDGVTGYWVYVTACDSEGNFDESAVEGWVFAGYLLK